MHAIAHGVVRTHVRESSLKVDSGRKIPCRTGESNLRKRPDGPTLSQTELHPHSILPLFNLSVAAQGHLAGLHPMLFWLTSSLRLKHAAPLDQLISHIILINEYRQYLLIIKRTGSRPMQKLIVHVIKHSQILFPLFFSLSATLTYLASNPLRTTLSPCRADSRRQQVDFFIVLMNHS